MTTLAVIPTLDGYILSSNAVYATCVAGSNLSAETADTIHVGQRSDSGYIEWIGYLNFDTSALPDDAIISAAILTLTAYGIANLDTDFSLQARAYDWGDTLTTADWQNPTQLGALTLLAHLTTSGVVVDTPFDLTDDAMIAAINPTGRTRMVLTSDRVVAGTVPTNHEYIDLYQRSVATAGFRPTLTITYTEAAPIDIEPASVPIGLYTPTFSVGLDLTPDPVGIGIDIPAPTLVSPTGTNVMQFKRRKRRYH